MSAAPIKFGTDGWRALIADDFTFANVRRVAGGIAAYVLAHEDPKRGVIIGYECKNVSRENALGYVLGYTIANDVSARDWQKTWGGSQWCRGKGFDTFCPLGPALVTPDTLKNPNGLAITTRVNGVTMQQSNTRDMIFPIDKIIEFLGQDAAR